MIYNSVYYLPVRDLYNPIALLRDLRVVSNDYYSPAGAVEPFENTHYLCGGLGVERSGQLRCAVSDRRKAPRQACPTARLFRAVRGHCVQLCASPSLTFLV